MMRINVVDNFKCQKQAFSVSRSLLTKHMAYFNKVLADYAPHDKINITIHCDVGVFSWLLDYIFELEAAKITNSDLVTKPYIENRTVVPLLISAEFLGFKLVVQDAIDFIVENFN